MAKSIYLDYAASTPVSERVFRAMHPFFSDIFANPGALHILGQRAQAAVDTARADTADVLGCSWKEIIFTSGATESINLAFRGVVKATKGTSGAPPHIVTTNIEHSAVLKTCRDLEEDGIEVTYLPVNSDGLVTAQQVQDALKENTVLVSVMYVNNEIGTVQPIAEIAKMLKGRNIAFHTDAVQAANYLDINVQNLSVDLTTLSGHKIYGPKGVGILYKKEGASLAPVITGGEQERGYRAGTENVPAIVGFAEALKETGELKQKEAERAVELRDYFIDAILKQVPSASLNGSRTERIPNNANFCFENFSSETLIPKLDEAGIYASGGSACTARVPEPSHVITALGKEKYAKNSMRFSLGRQTTKKDLDTTLDTIVKLVQK